MRPIRESKEVRWRATAVAVLALMFTLNVGETANAQCGLFGGAGLFGRRARAESYSAGYGAACYGQSYEAYGASCYGQSYAGTFYATSSPRPIRRLLGGIFAPRRAAAYYIGPSVNATYYYPAPSAYGVGGVPSYGYSDGYVNSGGANYPPSWQAAQRCPGGICPNPSPQQPQAPAVPPKVTPTPQAPSVPPPAPHVSDPHHSRGNGCQCGDAKCTHGIGVCPCRNPRCICEHEGGRRFPR